MGVKYYDNVEQGTDEWLELRAGILTASVMHQVVTPKLKPAKNDKVRTLSYSLLAQRITGRLEPNFQSYDMERGVIDEITARDLYSEKYEPAHETGFITNDKWGFTLGYSPDGLVGDDGLLEIKSKLQKLHTKVIINNVTPEQHVIQCQHGLLVSERKWIDFISYCEGMPMFVTRSYPIPEIQEAIINASREFYDEMDRLEEVYRKNIVGLVETEYQTPDLEIK